MKSLYGHSRKTQILKFRHLIIHNEKKNRNKVILHVAKKQSLINHISETLI